MSQLNTIACNLKILTNPAYFNVDGIDLNVDNLQHHYKEDMKQLLHLIGSEINIDCKSIDEANANIIIINSILNDYINQPIPNITNLKISIVGQYFGNVTLTIASNRISYKSLLKLLESVLVDEDYIDDPNGYITKIGKIEVDSKEPNHLIVNLERA